jgi:hypothetical protein
MTHLVNHQLSSAKIHSQEQLVLAVSSCPLAQKHAQRAQHQANGLWLAASEANLHKKTLDKVEKFIAGRIKGCNDSLLLLSNQDNTSSSN